MQMRSFVLIAVGALALVLAGASRPAATVTKTVKVTATAFSPASVTIKTTDAVKWSNTDTKAHQVVANNGAFASPTIAAGHTWTHTFNTAGTYRYHDALHPALTGKVVVTGPPPAVTIGAATPIILYGQTTSIAGTVSTGQANEKVDVYAQPYGAPSAALVAMPGRSRSSPAGRRPTRPTGRARSARPCLWAFVRRSRSRSVSTSGRP
ncbi:MAG: hypothetical protein E6G24_09670 [Actinobacteria bacterium]|nr:MAG: hypothetical protein E6G24_09670 [Actinomycetota bacterium]